MEGGLENVAIWTRGVLKVFYCRLVYHQFPPPPPPLPPQQVYANAPLLHSTFTAIGINEESLIDILSQTPLIAHCLYVANDAENT